MLLTRNFVALAAATIVTLTVLSSCVALEVRTPDLEAYANYEDMRRYIASRSQRSNQRYIDNPTDDTYITAYNEHHELASRERPRRATIAQQARKLPSEPQLLKFEISDAIEPSAEVKELIRQHRSREEKLTTATSPLEASEENNSSSVGKDDGKAKVKRTTVAPTRAARGARAKSARSKRPKRATAGTPNQQAFNFQVQLIPFDISEAREPDEHTKEVIRRMRNLELQKLRTAKATSTAPPATVVRVHRNAPATTVLTKPLTAPVPTFNPGKYYRPKTGKLFMKRKGKRVKRSAPQMIRFELEDAREPNTAMLEQLRLAKQSHVQSIDQPHAAEEKPSALNKREARMDTKPTVPAEQPVKEDVDEGDSDLKGGESKRLFVYKEAPVIKAKKSIGSLPVEVQKIITHLMKDQGAGAGGGKAYVKYIPAHMVDYRQLKSLYGAKLALPATYSIGGAGKLSPASYIKYIPPHQKAEQLQVQIHPVPVVEKIRYIYTPVASAPAGHGYDADAHAAVAAQEQAAAHAAATHAAQAAYAGHNVHAVAEAQAAQAAHAVKVAQGQHMVEVAHAAADYAGAKGNEGEGGAHESGGIAQPIVVQEAGGAGHQLQKAAPAEVHHTYAADVSHAMQEEVPVAVAIKAVHFRPSKPDPLLNENKLSEGGGAQSGEVGGHGGYSVAVHGGGHEGDGGEQHFVAEYGGEHSAEAGHQRVEQYKYELVPAAAQEQNSAEVPQVKIEYHGPEDAIKQNFKELPEFKELSTLVGKSTEDQIHGLTYLLAKEMQNKLKLQRKKFYVAEGQEAHTNTAPIVFPPESQQIAENKQKLQQQQQQQIQAHAGVFHGRLIGMAKSKEYIPIVEHGPAAEQKASASGGNVGGAHGSVQHIAIPAPKQYVAIKVEPKAPLPNSYIEYGLSPNYQVVKSGGESGGGEGAQRTKLVVEQVIHHPNAKYNGGGGGGVKAIGAEAELHGGGASSAQSLSYGEDLQYASKYAFGYRIRDFNTGNDFGHKQNRDLDGVTRGQYHILLPDGRIQNVIYHADDTGFHADVSFETGH